MGAPAQPGRLSWHLPTQLAVQGREPKLKKLTGVTSAASALVGGANAGSKLEKLGAPNRADSDLVSINEIRPAAVFLVAAGAVLAAIGEQMHSDGAPH